MGSVNTVAMQQKGKAVSRRDSGRGRAHATHGHRERRLARSMVGLMLTSLLYPSVGLADITPSLADGAASPRDDDPVVVEARKLIETLTITRENLVARRDAMRADQRAQDGSVPATAEQVSRIAALNETLEQLRTENARRSEMVAGNRDSLQRSINHLAEGGRDIDPITIVPNRFAADIGLARVVETTALRLAPETATAPIGQLAEGQVLLRLGSAVEENWWILLVGDQAGFVRADSLEDY